MAKIRVQDAPDSSSEADSFTSLDALATDSDTSETQPTKRAKNAFDPSALASAFQTVLRQSPAGNAEQSAAPILSRRKAIERSIEEEQIDHRARQILKAQILATQDAVHITEANRPETLNFERSLRKLATRGVVQLFNTIQTSQQEQEDRVQRREQEKLRRTQAGPRSAMLPPPTTATSQNASYLDFLMQQRK